MNGRRVAFVTAILLACSGALYPCGGVYELPVGLPFAPFDETLDQVLGNDPYYGPYTPEAVRFIHPFVMARPDDAAPVRGLLTDAYGDYVDRDSLRRAEARLVAGINLDAFRRALASDDFAAADREARALAGRIVDLPSALADSCQPQLRAAVEFVELESLWPGLPKGTAARFYADSASGRASDWPPALAEAVRLRGMSREGLVAYADSAPSSRRAASLAWVALQDAMRRRIPDGWGNEVREAATPQLWKMLHDRHTEWLARFPDSPLADLVRFSEVRVDYFEGDSAAAWRRLLMFYPDRHYARAVYEMRYLFAHGAGPDSAVRGMSRFDGALRAATTTAAADGGQWCRQWAAAEAARPAPWAVNMEERLLHGLVRRFTPEPGSVSREPLVLPRCFPAEPSAPTPFWGRMRLMALLAANQSPAARAQLALLDSAADLAPLRARFALEDGDWVRAILVPDLDSAAVRYLVRVLAPDSALSRLPETAPWWIRNDAAITLAAGRAAAGDWLGGARLLAPLDSGRARLWRTAAELARDSSFAGRLAFARFLHGERGRLMFPRDGDWYRSVSRRVVEDYDPAYTTNTRPAWAATLLADESARIERHFYRTTEDYLALRQYAGALDHPAGAAGVIRRTVTEADGVYRSLIDWRNASTPFWYKRLRDSPEARTIRRAGHAPARSPG